MKVSAIVPAAGLGLRLKSDVAKPLTLIKGEEIIIHTLRRLSAHPLINEIIVVFNSKDTNKLKELLKEKGITKIKDIVKGGPTRKHSVKNGLNFVGDADLVLIHDGVRPFIEEKIITNTIEAAYKYGATVVGVPLKSTIKRIHPVRGGIPTASDDCLRQSISNGVNLKELEIDCTLRRDDVWEIQTPQVFKRDLIIQAYKNNIETIEAPDDAFLVERLGHRVTVVMGSYLNIKITTPEDLILAEAIASLNSF